MATILLFQKTSQRFYYFGQNEKTILLFGVGRGYEFTEVGRGYEFTDRQEKTAAQEDENLMLPSSN